MQNATKLEMVEAILQKHNLMYERINESTLACPLQQKNGNKICYISQANNSILTVETVLTGAISSEKYPAIMETLCLINETLLVGSMDLNIKHGVVAFRTGIFTGGAVLPETVVQHLIFFNWHVADRFCGMINRVVFGNISPRQALEELGKNDASDNQHEDEPKVKTDGIASRIKGLFN